MRKRFTLAFTISTCFLGLTLSLNTADARQPKPTPPVPAETAVATNTPTVVQSAPTNSVPVPVAAIPTVVAAPAATLTGAVESASISNKPGEPVIDSIVIDYNEADMQRVLRTLATKANVNLIIGDEVTGKVTVHLEGVGYEDALRLIIESKGYAFVKDKSVVRVKSKESLDAEPVEVRVLTLNYAKAEDIKKTIEPVMSGRGKLQIDVRSNSLILSDTPASLSKLAPLIQSLDTQTPQVMIEARFIETTKNPQKALGINWAGTLINHSVTFGGSSATPGTLGATVTDFGFSKGVRPATSWLPTSALLDVGQANMVFSFLNQDSETELLANPRVVTTDNTKAKIAIATQYPIPDFTFSEQTASLQISGFNYKDIGIILNVTPRINKNSFITLDVAPEASSSTENSTLSSGGGSSVLIPIINTRTASTTVLIKSGNTLAIGGLMRQDVSDNYTKVPVLGDMPGLGPLFRSKSLNKTKRDLLIFLTPTIIAPDAQTGYEDQVNGIKSEQIYTNDKWMPHDNAIPASQVKAQP